MTAPTPDPEPISLDPERRRWRALFMDDSLGAEERHAWRSNDGNCDAYIAALDEWMRRGEEA